MYVKYANVNESKLWNIYIYHVYVDVNVYIKTDHINKRISKSIKLILKVHYYKKFERGIKTYGIRNAGFVNFFKKSIFLFVC